MPLKAVLKTLDGLAEPLKALYKKVDDEYHLDVEDMVPAAKLDEFRENNRALNRKLTEVQEELKDLKKKYDGVDPDEYKTLKEQDTKLKDKKLIEAGKIDELLESKLSPIRKSFEEQVAAERKKNEELLSQLERIQIEEALTKAALARGVRATALDDVKWRARQIWKLKDGKAVPMDPNGTTIYGANGQPLSMEEWLDKLSKDAPHLFEPSKGSGAPPNSGGSGGSAKMIQAGDPVAFGKHLEAIAKGEVTVQRG